MQLQNRGILKRFGKTASEYLTNVYSQPVQRRNLVDFTVGIIALMTGNMCAVFYFYFLNQRRVFAMSLIAMNLLGLIMGFARRKGEVRQIHYILVFGLVYFYGMHMFLFGDNTRGIMMFGLAYPVLSVFILKRFWGNILVVAELITGLVIEKYFNPLAMHEGTIQIYMVLYLMFWFFSIVMEESKLFLEKRMREQQERLAFFANYDYLTKLFNRRRFYERVAELYPKGDRARSVAVIIMDLDNFKIINDTYGHNVGDEILAEAAERIRNNVRRDDICCRWGGEEFLILAQAGHESCGQQLGQKLCDAIGQEPCRIPDGRLVPFTASVGVVYTRNIYSFDMETLVRYADDNLYRAKKAGKNRVCSSTCACSIREGDVIEW